MHKRPTASNRRCARKMTSLHGWLLSSVPLLAKSGIVLPIRMMGGVIAHATDLHRWSDSNRASSSRQALVSSLGLGPIHARMPEIAHSPTHVQMYTNRTMASTHDKVIGDYATAFKPGNRIQSKLIAYPCVITLAKIKKNNSSCRPEK